MRDSVHGMFTVIVLLNYLRENNKGSQNWSNKIFKCFNNFFIVGPPKESIFLTAIYVLYLSHHYTYIDGSCSVDRINCSLAINYKLHFFMISTICQSANCKSMQLIWIQLRKILSPLPGFEPPWYQSDVLPIGLSRLGLVF